MITISWSIPDVLADTEAFCVLVCSAERKVTLENPKVKAIGHYISGLEESGSGKHLAFEGN